MNLQTNANLDINVWYKAIMLFGGTIAIAGIFLPVQIFDNKLVTLFGLGLFLFGLGIWGNKRAYFFDGNGREIRGKRGIKYYLVSGLKYCIILIGVFLVVTSTYQIVLEYFS
ncbi:hypothetical protein GF391_03490 [Candidatus Uhrbacteria bacterium]|nr:hypothetical protein [Candidatus Uhrbacteria bacterium]